MHWVTITHVGWQLLGWPAGIILGNLLASVIWSSIFEWRLGVHRKKTDRSIDHKLAVHQMIVSDLLAAHHKSIKEMINNGQPEPESIPVQGIPGLPGT